MVYAITLRGKLIHGTSAMSNTAAAAPKIRRALISVSDKAGLVAFARALDER